MASSGESGRGGGIQKKRLEKTGSGALPLTDGHLAVHKSPKPFALLPSPMALQKGASFHSYPVGGGNWQTRENPLLQVKNGAAANVAPPCPVKEHLKSLLVKSPAPERQVRGDALGSVQGKKAQGLMVQQASTLWRGA